MTTDFRALCAELADAYLRLLEYINNSTWLGYEPSDDPLLLRARAALAEPESIEDRIAQADAEIEASMGRIRKIAAMPAAQLAAERRALDESDGPAVPDGREPASVTGQPSDEELLETLDKATATFPPRHPEAEGLNAVEYPLALELRKARAVLARWGSPAPQPPAEGEVAEFITQIKSYAEYGTPIRLIPFVVKRAADLLQRGQSALHRLHRLQQENARFREPERTILCDILANGTLLPDPDGKRYGVQPVPVSERLPVGVEQALIKAECALSDIAEGEPEENEGDADALLQWAEQRAATALSRIRPVMRLHGILTSEWPPLPAHALPVPQGEVE